MKIVTGHRGTPHISSNDTQALNQGIFGNGNYVLNVGEKFDATLVTATSVSIADGEGVMQGVHFRVEPGTVDTLELSNGVSGYNRKDLICARYTKDVVTGVENVEWIVIEGEPSEGTAADPDYEDGDILQGETADYPMYRVSFSGVTPTLSPYSATAVEPIAQTGSLGALTQTMETQLEGLPIRMRCGEKSFSVHSGEYVKDLVEFGVEYPTKPKVIAGFKSGSTDGGFGNCSCAVTDVMEAGFSISVFNADSATRSPIVVWLAVWMS